MADILETIAEATRARVAISKETISDTAIRDLAYASGKGDFSFEKALKNEGMSFICECKKASPSKGIIAEDFPYIDIACGSGEISNIFRRYPRQYRSHACARISRSMNT